MSGKESPQNVIKKFENRQKIMPYVLGAVAGILVILGIFIIIAVASGNSKPFAGLFATKTPPATATFTPTATQPTPTASMTPTITLTPTPEATATASGPQRYQVKEGDNCYDIAASFNVYLEVLLLMNNFPNGTCPIVPGVEIWIPAPGQELPTPTPIPSDLPRGTEIIYYVQRGDTLAIIADKTGSTVEDILKRNPEIKDQNLIELGQPLKVRVHLVTPTRTLQPTSTLAGAVTATPTPKP